MLITQSMHASFLAGWILVLTAISLPAAEREFLPGVKRVVFLGDSITYSGQYIEYIETCAALQFPEKRIEFLNLGLPSETVSGLSEPGHANGAFPRPDLHERLARVLAETKPDLIVACYGMNDGIYYPFGPERFQKFKDGMTRLRERAGAAGAKVLHVTPPVFDPVPLAGRTLPAGRDEYREPYEGYDDVLERYSAWLIGQRTKGWEVVDVHGPIKRHLAQARSTNAAYRLAGDGVHINATGHWLMAREILVQLGAPAKISAMESPTGLWAGQTNGREILKLVQDQQRMLKDAWLNKVGHQRPGMNKGLPLADAEKRSAELGEKIRALARTER
jgi:lysophospholipase L1-like esterase